MDDPEVWLGDEEEAELPILAAPPGSPPADLATRRPVRRRLTPSRGVPTSAAPDARRQVLAEATGRAQPEPDAWRADMELGQRDRAAGNLTTGGRRRGSGFGLA